VRGIARLRGRRALLALPGAAGSPQLCQAVRVRPWACLPLAGAVLPRRLRLRLTRGARACARARARPAGAMATMGKLLLRPETRAAAVSMLGKTADLGGDKVRAAGRGSRTFD
jgi:hypothetical protein